MTEFCKVPGCLWEARDPVELAGPLGTPLGLAQRCLENPRDCGAWWAAVYGVAQGRPQLNHLAAAAAAAAWNATVNLQDTIEHYQLKI